MSKRAERSDLFDLPGQWRSRYAFCYRFLEKVNAIRPDIFDDLVKSTPRSKAWQRRCKDAVARLMKAEPRRTKESAEIFAPRVVAADICRAWVERHDLESDLILEIAALTVSAWGGSDGVPRSTWVTGDITFQLPETVSITLEADENRNAVARRVLRLHDEWVRDVLKRPYFSDISRVEAAKMKIRPKSYDALHAPYTKMRHPREADAHLEWLARFQVGNEDYDSIAAGPTNKEQVRKAIQRAAPIVGLKLRRLPAGGRSSRKARTT